MKRLNEKPVGRWAINIDLEGFGHLYDKEHLVLLSLGDLMEGIFRIGTQYYPESPDRIFAHQLGDGFVIVSDFPEDTFERPVAIALSLLRHVAHSGRYAKAAISEGEFADIQSCYPSSIVNAAGSNKRVRLGSGIMTLFPVMGTALIRAISVAKKCPSGPMLAVAAANRKRLPDGIIVHEVSSQGIIVVDWIHSENELAKDIASKSQLKWPDTPTISKQLRDYCQTQPVKEGWKTSVHDFLGVPH
ncbi:MAG: hypothetical protein IMF11_13515 [Proteobacteria bacterium]|nr:hypothetical protein [Pseudomonadota bacterium]